MENQQAIDIIRDSIDTCMDHIYQALEQMPEAEKELYEKEVVSLIALLKLLEMEVCGLKEEKQKKEITKVILH